MIGTACQVLLIYGFLGVVTCFLVDAFTGVDPLDALRPTGRVLTIVIWPLILLALIVWGGFEVVQHICDCRARRRIERQHLSRTGDH